MSKKLLFLLILFVMLIPLCLFVMSKSTNFSLSVQTPEEKFSHQKPPPQPTVTTSLAFSPLTQRALPGQKQTISVIIDSLENTKEKTPQLIQLEIAYDPRALLDLSILPGDFFIQPKLLLSTQNTHTGRISYAIEEKNIATTNRKGTIANLSFLPNLNFLERETQITLLPKTTIRGKDNKNLFTISPLASISATIYFR